MTDNRVDILDDTTVEVLDQCYGPRADGRCPRAGWNGAVACAGRRIAPTEAGAEYWLMWVPPGSQHCPLAWNLESVGY